MRKILKNRMLILYILCLLLSLAAIMTQLFYDGSESIRRGLLLGELGALLLTIVLSIFLLRSIVRKKIRNDAVSVSLHQHHYLDRWSIPYVIVDASQKMIWHNSSYTEQFGSHEAYREDSVEGLLGEFFEIPETEEEPIRKRIKLADRHYSLYIALISKNDDDVDHELYALSLEDITHQVALEKENVEMRPLAGLLYVDNYDAVVSSLDEHQRPMLEAMIYRKLSDFTASLEGILTRQEKDRFLIVFQQKGLEALIQKRFQILEEMKKVYARNMVAPTISIGIGVADSLSRSQEYARTAVDLALGRGGDQAIIKNDEKYQFFGGNSSGTEKNNRVRARLIAFALRELITESDRVLIMGHKNPDLDCFGAALGMFRIVTMLKKPANIVVEENHPAIDLMMDRIRVEKDYNNVIITPERALEYTDHNTMVIMVDVNRPSICACPELLSLTDRIAVIDHHRTGLEHVQNAQVSYVEPFASSASEMVTEILQYIAERIRLKPVEADGLFAGIQLDTKEFSSKTGVRTFEAAAYLRRNGADAVRVRKLFRSEMAEYQAKAHVVSQAEILRDQIALSRWTGIGVDNAVTIAAKAADELLNISDVKASFVLTQMEEKIWISARSLGEINVQIIMEKIGGGGHLTMAGAQIESSMDEVVAMLSEAVEAYFNER